VDLVQDGSVGHVLHEIHGAGFDIERVRRWCREFGVEERLSAF